jgi:hypothetical protein
MSVLVTQGNGKAVHNSQTVNESLVPLCDAWGGSNGGSRVSRIRVSTATVATCKRCLKIAASK